MYKAIPRHYPEAILFSDHEERIITEFKDRKMDTHHSIWATSICSDELNNHFIDFQDLFAGPGPFHLGGISGLPFTGVTGMNAFLSHVPTHGAAFILYGPHIGVTEDGHIGRVNRQYQFLESTCCGSLVASLENLKNDAQLPFDKPYDYQQARVIDHLYQDREEILSDPYPLKRATDLAFDAIQNKMKHIIESVQPLFEDIQLFLIGGIIINTDWGIEDYFEIRNEEWIVF